ncbi:MAG: hypothetical protein KME10_24305 [Plectolyngbya sp. WJT66-NPBG17]|nr:hypothetical protein [Plectolyngbya sp. WJT66-NPBG17]
MRFSRNQPLLDQGYLSQTDEAQVDLLRRLKCERILPYEVADLFYQLRVVRNQATHQYHGTHSEALTTLKIARQLGIWFHRAFSADRTFKPTPFVPPPNPADASRELADELTRLKQDLNASRTEAERARIAAEDRAKELLSAEEKARNVAEEQVIWEQLTS